MTYDLVIHDARVDGARVDIAIAGERIAAIGDGLEGPELDAGGRLVSPAFVQPHIHLDKVRTGPLLGPNRSGTLAEAIAISHAVKRAATVEEVRERAGEVIRAAVIAGTTAIRSHVDVDTIGGLKGLRGVAAARADHADLCEIQLVAFPQEGIWRDPGTDELMAEAMKEGADVVGGMPHWEDGLDEARRHIEFCLDLARRHDADVDMHVDETDDPYWRSFEILVEEAARRDWGPRTTAGHVCAMAVVGGRLRGVRDPPGRRRGRDGGHQPADQPDAAGPGRPRAAPARHPAHQGAAGGGRDRGGRAGLRRRRLLSVRPRGPAAGRADHRARRPARHAGRDRRRAADGDRGRGPPAPPARLRARARLPRRPRRARRRDPADALREQAPRRWVLRGGRVVAETVREQRLVR